MARAATLHRGDEGVGGLAGEVLSLAAGAAFTLGLFLAVAGFEDAGPPPVEADFADLRALSLPLEAPPPRPLEAPPAGESAAPFAGLEIGPTESPVKIAVVPPDLRELIPAPAAAPAAVIQPARLYTDFKPRTELGGDLSRIFQAHEVDKKPSVISRPAPRIPPLVRDRAETLRVTLLVVIDPRGAVTSIRILQSSGNPRFDAIIVGDVRDAWVFSPAVKRGKNVRCMIQQSVRVNWSSDSPFEL